MYRSHLYFIYLVFIAIAKADVGSSNTEYRHDYSYMEEAGGWLKLHHMPATFIEAFLHCKLEGAVLASPLNVNLQIAMGIMQEASMIHRDIFTGIHATISKTDLTSIEGIPLSQIPVTWAPGEPRSSKDCIIMLRDGTVAFAYCNHTYPYVCYRKKTRDSVITECGTVDTGYKGDPYTGSCYKFHRHAETWRRAQMTCLAEGGHLAVINSDYEATVLQTIFSKYPKDTIKASVFRECVSLGFLDWNKMGAWYTLDGKTLEEAGYSKWEHGTPDNRTEFDSGQYCGGMLRNGNLDDLWCESVPFAFICEKTFK